MSEPAPLPTPSIRSALLRWRLRLIGRRHGNAWNAVVVAALTVAVWSYGPQMLGALGAAPPTAEAAAAYHAADSPDPDALTQTIRAALTAAGLAIAVGLAFGAMGAYWLLGRSPDNLFLHLHPIGAADMRRLRALDLLIADYALLAPPAVAFVASGLTPFFETTTAVAIAAGAALVLVPILVVLQVAIGSLALALARRGPGEVVAAGRPARGWGIAGALAGIAPFPLGPQGRMLLRRDLALLLRRAYPRTLLLPALVAVGPLFAALLLQSAKTPGMRRVQVFIAGAFAATLCCFLIAVDMPRWRSTFSIADRLSPVRGSAARRATAALACFFAVPAAVLPAAIMPLVRPEAPEMEALGLAVAMATVTVAVAHFAAAFGMASGAHTPQLVLAASTTGQGGAGAGGTEITAFPITTGFLALVLGITAAIWPPWSLPLPLVALLLFGGYNHRGEVVWERAEVQS